MRGVISAGDAETAATGAAILRKGGNAVDAAVAAAFASFIAEIGFVHLGGSGLAQVFKPGNGDRDTNPVVYDFFSPMPGIGRSGLPDPLDFQKVTVDFGPTTQDFYLGRGSVAVPGNIAGLCILSSENGRLPLSTLLEPAIKLAREGFNLSDFQAANCELLRPMYTYTAGMRQIFNKNGRLILPGESLFIPHLAQTLEELARNGEIYARSGPLAQAIVADQEEHGGLITSADLEQFEVARHKAISVQYREYEVLLPPPSSIGGVLTAFTLNLLGHFEVGKYRHHSAEHLQLLFEVMAATTRARPVWDSLSGEYASDEALAYFLHPSFVGRYVDEVKSALSGDTNFPVLSEPTPRPDTSHISVIDGEGLAVSLTTTAGESAGYVVPGTGLIPNNILGEEDLHPAGFHILPPGQRINTMMTPTIVLCDGTIRLVVGSGGSIRIRSAIMQVLSNLLDFRMKLDPAVNLARVHLESGVFHCEHGVDPEAMSKLESMGYKLNRWDRRSIYFGGAHSVSRTPSGRLVAAGDNRRGGSIEVVD
ncbi:MAG TPA: gamma-glutamyltransferase [candidate division Zixibacteria bacterium]|nr:gamma-glutamyltransferase [candidate division Zixibacteria bacterium]